MSSGPAAPRLVIRIAGRLAPRSRRDAWQRQWEAELHHRWQRQLEGGAGGRSRGPGLLRWSLGALRHALWLRWSGLGFGTVSRDLRFAVRSLRAGRVASLTVIGTLALGIGATTAIFTLVNAALLRPLPYDDPDRLVMVWQTNRAWIESPDPFFQRVGARLWVAYPAYEAWAEHGEIFESVAAVREQSYTLVHDDSAERVWAAQVAGPLDRVLGVAPSIGRWFGAEEDRAGAPSRAVLSHDFWQSELGGVADVIGRQVVLNGAPHAVIGVMPAGFRFPQPGIRLWTNLPDARRGDEWTSYGLQTIARLAIGVAPAVAEERLLGLTRQLYEAQGDESGIGAYLQPRREYEIGDSRSPLLLLLGAVALLLLIACANVTSLLLVRAADRRREVAVRVALGASRRQVMRQFVLEAVLLAVAGAALGGLFARRAASALGTLLPSSLEGVELPLDLTVLSFAALIAVLTGATVGAVSCLDLIRHAPATTLASASRGASGGRAHRRALSAVVIAQVAMALMLLVGASLLLTSLGRLLDVERGFDERDVLTLSVELPVWSYMEPAAINAFTRDAIARLATLPSAQATAATSSMPLGGSTSNSSFEIDGMEEQGELQYTATVNEISPDYLATLRIPLLRGRAFTDADVEGAERVALISESVAREFWPGDDPLGKRLRHGSNAEWHTVVGIVGDVLHESLQADRRPIVYAPLAQDPGRFLTFAVRGEGAVVDADSAREAIWEADSTVPIYRVETLEAAARRNAAEPRARTVLLATAAAAAVLLAVLGVYGAMAYAVRQRTHELGIRIAVGARRTDIVRQVLRWGIGLGLTGLVIGVAGSLAAGRLLSGLLYGVTAGDPFILAASSAGLLGVAIAACAIPSIRAARTDPMLVLRGE